MTAFAGGVADSVQPSNAHASAAREHGGKERLDWQEVRSLTHRPLIDAGQVRGVSRGAPAIAMFFIIGEVPNYSISLFYMKQRFYLCSIGHALRLSMAGQAPQSSP